MEGDKMFSWGSLKNSVDVAHGKTILDLERFLS